jgi:hypothetical protein
VSVPFANTTYYLPTSFSHHDTTMVVLVLFMWLLPLAAIIVFAVEHAREKELARHDTEAQPTRVTPLAPGPIVLVGKVDDDGEGPAVTVAVKQEGWEYRNKGNFSHMWREVSREVSVRPFYVVRPSGERVRVEPDERAFLVDKLDGIEPQAPNMRIRRATLTAGEPVFVVGEATSGFDPKAGGYRDSASSIIVRPPRARSMLISTSPPAQRHVAGAKLAGRAMRWSLLLFVTTQLFILRVDALTLFGHIERARAEGPYTWQEYVKPKNARGYWVTHYGLQLTSASATFRHEANPYFYTDVLEHRSSEAPVLVAGGYHQLGSRVAIEDWKAILVPMWVVFWLFILLLWKASRMPWYERRKIIDGGRGHLDSKTISCR